MTQITMPRLETVPSLPDRCDRCAAAGKLRLTLLAGGDLVFCGHHANQHAQELLRLASLITTVDGFEWRGSTRATSAG